MKNTNWWYKFLKKGESIMTAIILETISSKLDQDKTKTVRLTVAQAIIRYLTNQKTEMFDGNVLPLFGGMLGSFGHGNVYGVGEALYKFKDNMYYYRGQNEQSMGHIAIAYARAYNRRRLMAVTASAGPGATNLTSAAAVANVSQLPVLFILGDIFKHRSDDLTLQQLESQLAPLDSVNDCLLPVSHFFDRITRPEQLMSSLQQAMHILTDPASTGPVTLAIPQDFQKETFDFPEAFFKTTIHYLRRPEPDQNELKRCVDILSQAKNPLIIAGGGLLYSGAWDTLAIFCEKHKIPFSVTQSGKGILPWNNPYNLGSIGITGTTAANNIAHKADVILCAGTKTSDITPIAKLLFKNPNVQFIRLNLSSFSNIKFKSFSLVSDAKRGLELLSESLDQYVTEQAYQDDFQNEIKSWYDQYESYHQKNQRLPSDANVIDVINNIVEPNSVVVSSSGGIPKELHKFWKNHETGLYHVEYGYSCPGYEIAGGLGVKIANPNNEVYILVGDGSYLMLHTELITAQQLGLKLNVIVFDNQGFGSINRQQHRSGLHQFGTMLRNKNGNKLKIHLAMNALSYGCHAVKVHNLHELKHTLISNKKLEKTCVTVIETDPDISSSNTEWIKNS